MLNHCSVVKSFTIGDRTGVNYHLLLLSILFENVYQKSVELFEVFG